MCPRSARTSTRRIVGPIAAWAEGSCGNTQAHLRQLEADYLTRADGSCCLPAAYALAYGYWVQGQIGQWIEKLEARLAEEQLEGDTRVGWLVARAQAEEIRRSPPGRYWRTMDRYLAGQGWIVYVYAQDDPLRLHDPFGLKPLDYSSCCSHLCFPEGTKKDCEAVDFLLWPANKGGNPDRLENQFYALNIALKISTMMDVCSAAKAGCAIYREGCKGLGEVCEAVTDITYSRISQHDLEDNIRDAIRDIQDELQAQYGAHIYVRVKWQKCQMRSCWYFWKRLKYDETPPGSGLYRCYPNPGDQAVGIKPPTPENTKGVFAAVCGAGDCREMRPTLGI